MYWSNYGLTEYLEILTEVGFTVLATSATGSGYEKTLEATQEEHPMVLCLKQ